MHLALAQPRTDLARASGIVLLTLAAGQFLMTLDSSVMNVSIATVADDVDTTVTGIQTAITFYTLVMAALMITGGKVGGILGRKRAFAIGCVIYGAGSLTTSISSSLTVLIIGWSVLEGIGAALIGTETELLLKSRWVLPVRALEAGYAFRYPGLEAALQQVKGALPRKRYHLF